MAKDGIRLGFVRYEIRDTRYEMRDTRYEIRDTRLGIRGRVASYEVRDARKAKLKPAVIPVCFWPESRELSGKL